MQNNGPASTISCEDVKQALRIQCNLLAGIKHAVRSLESCVPEEVKPGSPDDTEQSTGCTSEASHQTIAPGLDCLNCKVLGRIGKLIMPSADCSLPDFREVNWEKLTIDDAIGFVEALLELPWAALSSFRDDHPFEIRCDLEALGRRPTPEGEGRR